MRKAVLLLVLSVFLLIACEDYEVGKCAHYDDGLFGDRDPCWRYSAEETRDLSYCNNIESDGMRSLCYGGVAAHVGDKSICNSAAQPDKCREEFEDESFDILENECLMKFMGKEDCLTDLAWEYKDLSPCSYVEDKPTCYAYVALASGDATICDRLRPKEEGQDPAGDCKEAMESMDVPQVEEKEEKQEKRECTFDKECENTCQGDNIVHMRCDLKEYKCVEDKKENCALETDYLYADVSAPRKCSEAQCVPDKFVAASHKEQLSNLVKELTATKQELTTFMLDANKRCLNGLADVTNKLIVETALLAGGALTRSSSAGLIEARMGVTKAAGYPAGDKLAGMFSFALDESLNSLSSATPQNMAPVDYIALNCRAYEQAGNDIELIEWKIDKAQEYYRQINSVQA